MRKSHTKSRKGCLQCKQKHVKCNEIHPGCGNCSRLELTCSFIRPYSALQASSPSSLITIAISHMHPGNNGSGQPLPIVDLELLHNFMIRTVRSMELGDQARQIVVDKYVELGFTRTYVLYTILAVSALHLLSQDRSRTELFAKATALQSTALQLVQPHISNLTQDDALGVMAFSSFTAMFARAEVVLNPYALPRDPIESCVECFQLVQGIKTVVSPHWQYLNSSWIAPALQYEDNREDIIPRLEQDLPWYIAVRNLVSQHENDGQRETCLDATRELFIAIGVLMSMPEDHYSTRLINSWVITAGKDFTEMLTQQHPIALVMLAHYAVLLSLRPNTWWLQGWPEMIIEGVDNILEGDYDDLLEWPKQMIARNRTATLTPMSGA